MCLAVPGKVVEWVDQSQPFARAIVEFGGVRREVGMALLPEVQPGDYVLVHAGVAISRVDEQEAAEMFKTLEEMAALDDVDSAENGWNEPGTGETTDEVS